MKLFLIGIAALAVVTGSASAKQWKSGEVAFQSGEGQPFVITDQGIATICTISSWPADSPIATLDCDDGKKHTMELIPPNAVKIDGMLLDPALD